MKTLILMLILTISSYSYSESLYVGLFTDHFVKGSFNETNSVILAQLDSGLTIGTMTNSYNNPSMLFGYVQPDKTIALGLLFATGYKPENFYLQDCIETLPVFPFPLLSVNLHFTDNVAFTANIIGGIVFNSGLTFSF